MVKAIKVQDISRNFNGIEYKELIDKISESILQLFPKRLPLNSFGEVSKTNIHNFLRKAIQIFLLFQLHMCVEANFSCILQS